MTIRGWISLLLFGMAFFFLAGLGVAAVRYSRQAAVIVGLPLFALAIVAWTRVRPHFRAADTWLRNRG